MVIVVFMSEIFNNLYDFIMGLINSLGVYGPLLASLFIIIESIIPPLPLCVFVTIIFIAYGPLWGFLLSWICTCIGCMISYFLVKKVFRKALVKRAKEDGALIKSMNYIEHLSLSKIMVILAIPFTPAFAMNIAAGLANMDKKKFFIAIVVSKIFLIYFWGIVGTSLVDSLHNPKSIITVVVMVVLAYLFSIIIKKVLKID